MDRGGAYARPVRRLCLACSLPAHLPCLAQAWPNRIPLSRIVPVAEPMRGVVSAWKAGRHGPPMAQAWPRQCTRLVWPPPRPDVLTGGKIFGENMAGKLL